MESNSEIKEQLLQLRALTVSTGLVHEAQLNHVKLWGGLMFGTGAGVWECDVSPPDKTITFRLQRDHMPMPAKRDITEKLGKPLKWLLGDDWLLVIMKGKRQYFKGTRAQSRVHEQREERVRGRRRPDR